MRSALLLVALSGALLLACATAGPEPRGRRIGAGLVVEYALAHSGVEPKAGLQGLSDKGARLFGALLEGKYGGASTNAYIGGHLPKTVHVTWRTDTEPGKDFTTGRVIGDDLVEVDKRVPEDVIRYANAGPGRSLRLIFRIKDDGVLFGWDVEEKFGGLLVSTMRGGEVPCYDQPRAANAMPNCTAGPLTAAPWYSPSGFKY